MAIAEKSCYWEVNVPEPFILDTKVSDEKFMSDMISVANAEEVSDLIHTNLQKPTSSFVIFCKEKELKKLFSISCVDFKFKLEKNGAYWLISVIDKNNDLIGRGEISKLGDKIALDKVKSTILSHMTGFSDKYQKGTVRLQNIIYKMELLKSQINVNKTILS